MKRPDLRGLVLLGPLLAVALVMTLAVQASAQTTAPLSLMIADVRNRALKSNRGYLSAQEEIVRAEGDIGRARSGALPQISFGGSYSHDFIIPSTFVEQNGEVMKFKFGFENNFGADITLRQPLWEGGKVGAAYKIAREYRQYSEAVSEQVQAAVLYQSDLLFYGAILTRAQLMVLQDALKAQTHNVEVVTRLYAQGMVPKFELLRAHTEEANLKPQILGAESESKLAEKRLKSFLGIDLAQEVTLVEEADDTSLAGLRSLSFYIDTALSARPEMRQAELMVQMRRRAITVAKAGYWPSLAAVSQYAWQSSSNDLRLNDNNTESFTAGLQLSFPIFDGGCTRGEVGKAKAELRQAELARSDLADQVRLEVEGAYDRLLEAKKSLDIQGDIIAEAEEGLRIAQLRYEAGQGTLLEVLSAQTALTQARSAQAAAAFAFRSARASLRLATTVTV